MIKHQLHIEGIFVRRFTMFILSISSATLRKNNRYKLYMCNLQHLIQFGRILPLYVNVRATFVHIVTFKVQHVKGVGIDMNRKLTSMFRV